MHARSPHLPTHPTHHPSPERNGVDQGMHNYFLFGGQLKALVSQLVIVDNEDGWIASVQSMPSLQRDQAARLLNTNGEPYAVVHQYDRSKALTSTYANLYKMLSPEELQQR